ncbi:MAG: beta-ketoacyl-[acyl-carrier-protein] synthase family protein [Pseudomonadota bacterium]|nr:beta-ketoacyl-[acyl-carrier-protein] synthase family protein [Pseudomonadota bacterium]
MRRVAVTGWGVVSPFGEGVDPLMDAVNAGRSAVRAFAGRNDGPWPLRAAAWNDSYDPRAHFPLAQLNSLDRTTQLAVVAARAALAMAGRDGMPHAEACGIHVGTGMGSAGTLDSTYRTYYADNNTRLRPLTVPTVMTNASAAQIALETGFAGANLTYSCACASSAVAIGEAVRRIRHGDAQLMLAGGSEALVVPSVVYAWEALRTLADVDAAAPSASCRPFSLRRSGLVLGEGAAFLVLEDWDAACARGARPLAEICGYGSGSDSGHLTRPTVEGQARAMAAALRDAALAPAAIGYINAHGTGTQANDSTESAAIRQVFGDLADHLPVSSTKAVHGHLLGAAAALELLVTLCALQSGLAPPTAHLDEPDPACALDHVRGAARRLPDITHAMSNSFAFGGTTGVLIARRVA